MEVLIRCTVAALLLAAGACDFIREPTVVGPQTRQLLVHSVLSAGSDTVRVLLTRTEGGQVSYAPIPVPGARVRIAGGGAEVLLGEAPEGFGRCLDLRADPSPLPPVAGPGCYAAVLAGGVRPGVRYTLEVEVPGAERASGQTTVPAVPEWILPAEGARVESRWSRGTGLTDSLLLHWRSTGASTEIPAVGADEVYAGDRRVPDARCALFLSAHDGLGIGNVRPSSEGDSLLVLAVLTNCAQGSGPSTGSTALRPDSVALPLLLAAYDSAYAAHAEAQRNGRRGIREGRASPGLSGAYGVFGSVATAQRRVVFVVSEP
jgi:hypothetical protein